MFAVGEDGLPQVLDSGFAAQFQLARLHRVRSHGQLDKRRGEKVEKIRAQRGVAHLRGINLNQLAGCDPLFQQFVDHAPQRAKELFSHRRNAVLLAAMQAHHLLLHHAFQGGVGVGAVEVP